MLINGYVFGLDRPAARGFPSGSTGSLQKEERLRLIVIPRRDHDETTQRACASELRSLHLPLLAHLDLSLPPRREVFVHERDESGRRRSLARAAARPCILVGFLCPKRRLPSVQHRNRRGSPGGGGGETCLMET